MALPNGLPQISDLGALLSTLGNDLVDIPLMQPTTSIGAPVAGYFYSSITNRAPMYDLRNDLGVNIGVNRFCIQQIYRMPKESGPNNEIVWGVVNDTYNQIRLVGNFAVNNGTAGVDVVGSTNDYIEITFYGTGLNILVRPSGGVDARVSTDGGSEGPNIFPSFNTTVIGMYSPVNTVVSCVHNLTLGIHTVKIRLAAGLGFNGFEVVNDSSSVKVNPGASWNDGKKLYNSAQAISLYNSGFESGALGTKGGRVVVYQKADGSIAKAVNPTNASVAYTSSADHSNEEIIRTYSTMEFGASRTTDFNSNVVPNIARAFTLDDGTTTLAATQTSGSFGSYADGMSFGEAASQWTAFTFVGTGLDIEVRDTAGTGPETYTFSIDGGTPQSWPYSTGSTNARIIKIVSGLPYGTHILRVTRSTASFFSVLCRRLIVYGPKKPTIPSGAIELADYNIMADFVANSTQGIDRISTGVLRKYCTRELTYTGSNWTMAGPNPGAYTGGFILYTNGGSGQTMSYTFWGTGIELRSQSYGTNSSNVGVLIDGVAPSGTAYGNWTYSAGTLNQAATPNNSPGSGVVFSGLSLGKHTITFTNNTAAQFVVDALDVVTPIHSHKYNGPFILQNILAIGSQGISDNRKLYTDINQKNISETSGVAVGSPQMTGPTFLPMPEMSTIIKVEKDCVLEISYNTVMYNSSTYALDRVQIYVDGVAQKQYQQGQTGAVSNTRANVSDTIFVPVSAGIHKIDAYWSTDAGTLTADGTIRNLTVREM